MVAKIKVLDTSIGVVIGAILFFPFSAVLDPPPKPFKDVEYTVEKNESGYLVSTSFTKTACVFDGLDVIGTSLGWTRPIHWYDISGPAGNREVGQQTFDLQVVTFEKLSELSLVTQHMCAGELVETVFLQTDLKGD